MGVKGKQEQSSVDARSRLNDRFKFSTSLKSRLGEREEEQYDSGDSLERDTGADLGDTTEKMVIQVTQSDDESKKPSKTRPSHRDHHRRGAEHRSEAMEEDDDEQEANNDVDHRKKP